MAPSLLAALQNWRLMWYGTTSNTGNAADPADPLHDGIANLLAFACNLNPTVHQPPPGQAALAGANIQFNYPRSKAAVNAGLPIAVEWSDTLAPGSWSTASVTENILSQEASVQNIQATLPAATGGRRLVRLRVGGL